MYSRIALAFAKLCLLVASLVFSAPISASAVECERIVQIDNKGTRWSPDWEVSYRIGDVWQLYEERYVELVPGLAFTKRPGQFLNINCNAPEAPVERQEFYPIGMVLKPLMVLRLPGPGQSAERLLYLVLTEYGHLKVVPVDDVQPLISGATYFFANSNTRVFMCRDPEDCPGNSPVKLVDGTEIGGPCSAAQCRASDEIGPLSGYAVGAAVDPPGRSARSAWTEVDAARTKVSSEGLASLSDEDRSAFCRPFPVKAFESGGDPAIYKQPHVTVDGRVRHMAYLSLCPDVSAGPATPPVKIVTKARAEEHFADLLQGSFYRRFGERNDAMLALVKELVNARLTGVKDCQTRVASSESFKAGVGVGFKVSAGVVELGAQADREWEQSFQQVLNEKEHMRFSAYLAPRFGAAADEAAEEWLLDLVFKSKCDISTVIEPSALVIHYPMFSDGKLEISAQETTNVYARVTSDLSGYEKNGSASLLRDGRFFTIRDAKTFYQWKAVVLETLRSSTMRFYVDGLPNEERRRMAENFFVHLIMAAAFHYDFAELRR